MSPKKVFLQTFGCQMNEADSARMLEGLARGGWEATTLPEEASLILLNSCAIRDKSDAKLLSALGRFKALRAAGRVRIGVGGCVAQSEKEALLCRVPHLDFVFGPDQVGELPALVARVEQEQLRLTETRFVEPSRYVFPAAEPEAARGRATAFVTVMKGCDNVCAFCVVPHTRGREVSRPVAEVLAEIGGLAAVGVREVTLLGQNVNSYAGGVPFAELLLRAARLPGIARVRFTTSHPHDLSDDLCDAFALEPRLMPHFHLPVQSGSDEVLRRMRRDYTAAAYLSRLARLRAARPGIAISTDVIVGFPGESAEDFERTLALVEEVRYDNLYAFAFSPRPHTAAKRNLELSLGGAAWAEVPAGVALERLARLQAVGGAHSLARHQAVIGAEVELLVEGPSRYDASRRTGRTPENQLVNFDGSAPAGELVRVRITGASTNALDGHEARRAPGRAGRLAVVA